MDDVACVRLVLSGDSAAYRTIIERYKNQVYGVAYRMLGNPEDAEDVAQEAFVRAYARIGSFDQNRKFSTWLLAITSHLCIDLLRGKKRNPASLDDFAEFLESREEGPESVAIGEEERREVRKLLARLPAKYRVVIVLRYWHDLSIAEIAEAVGATQGAVKTMLHRARLMLSGRMPGKEVHDNVLSPC